MTINSTYEQRIEAYIKSNPTCVRDRIQRIEIEGQIQDLPVYRLPIKLLIFNVENGRFAADLEMLEASRRRKLNTRNPDDSSEVRNILLTKSPHDTKVLKEDLKKRGQIDPGVITAAGVVINANRRMAVLTMLYEETGDDKYSYLETVILPRSINETEIYKIEARLQYAKDFKIGFGAVNELIKIQEGLNKGMTQKELAALLLRDEKYISEHLAQLKYLEAYSKFSWGKIDYKRIEDEKITEVITEVEKNQRKFRSEGSNAVEIKQLLEMQFAYIKSGCTYRDVREFGKYGWKTKLASHATEQLKKGKISEEAFKDKIDEANERVKIKKDENKPLEIIVSIYEQFNKYQDADYDITPEVKKYLKKISSIIIVLTKKK